jgi:hypothetical protein
MSSICFLAEEPAEPVIALCTLAKAQVLVDMVRQNKSSDAQLTLPLV